MTLPESTIRLLFNEALGELIASYAGSTPQVWTVSSVTGRALMGAEIRLQSEEADGRMVLLTTEPALQGLAQYDQLDCNDWLRELINQLAGRWKNKLSVSGIRLQVGISQTLDVRAEAACRQPVDEMVEVRWDRQSVFGHLQISGIGPAEHSEPAVDFGEAFAAEGSIRLF